MERKKRNKGQFEHIGGITQRILKKYRKGGMGEIAAIWEQWKNIVGGEIAEHTVPSAIKGSLLIVNASSSVWVHHLQFLKKDIINNINQTLGKELVDEIRFKIGSG